MDTLAASGGYYCFLRRQFLMANETTITGSIGVIIQTLTMRSCSIRSGWHRRLQKRKFKDM